MMRLSCSLLVVVVATWTQPQQQSRAGAAAAASSSSSGMCVTWRRSGSSTSARRSGATWRCSCCCMPCKAFRWVSLWAPCEWWCRRRSGCVLFVVFVCVLAVEVTLRVLCRAMLCPVWLLIALHTSVAEMQLSACLHLDVPPPPLIHQ